MMRLVLILMLLSQVACTQVLIGIKVPPTIHTLNPPGVPTLITPSDGVDSVATSVTLAWSAVDSADTYTANLATDTGFTALVVNWTTTGVSAAISGLDSGEVYYWRVRATNIAGSSAWTTRRSFTTITQSVPVAPTIISPLAVDSVEIAPLLTWLSTATATSYKVQLALSNTFISLLVDTTVLGTSVQIDPLIYNTTYYWRVRATNTIGTGAYSSTYFTTTPLLSLVRPAPVTTLAVYATDTSSISLRWIAVGNDSLSGYASSYDARYSLNNITSANFSSATQITGEQVPDSAGQYDSLTVTGLTPDTQYFFALKVYDDTTGVSTISNVATATTDTIPIEPLGPGYPNAVTTLAVDSTSPSSLYLSWTATGDDGNVGTATTYDIRYSTRRPASGELITNTGFDANVDGWSVMPEGGTLSWDASHGRVDGGALKLVYTAQWSGVYFPIANTDADSVTFSFYVYSTVKDTFDTFICDQNWVVFGSSYQRVVQASTWTRISLAVKASGLQTQLRVGINFLPGVSGNTFWIDDASCSIGIPWTSLTQATGEPSPSVSGTLEHYTIAGLAENTLYYAAVKVIDDSSNTSDISNVVYGTTRTNVDTNTITRPQITSGSIWVGKHGSDSNSGADSLHAYLTISKGVSVASAGDTIVVLSGTYAEKVTVTASGNSTNPIVLAAYGTQTVTITGSGSVTAWSCRSLLLDGDYIIVHGVVVKDALYNGTTTVYYWVQSLGDHNTFKWCRFVADGDIESIYTTATNRILNLAGRYATLSHSYIRGGAESIELTASSPRYYLLEYDTVNASYNNNIVAPGDNATLGVYHAGLIQYCVLDTAYNEDNIQFQQNYDLGPTVLVNSGIVVRRNFMANAGENCIDLKATNTTVTIEDNTLVNSYGDDNGPSDGDDDQGGKGIIAGADDYSLYTIVRNNIIHGNHGGMHIYPGMHVYNNTFSNNSHSYRGFNSTSGDYQGVSTDNESESGELKVFLNNIVYDESGASNRVAVQFNKANASNFRLDYNIYYQSGGSPVFQTNYPTDWPTMSKYTGLSAWQTALQGSAFSGWTGKDAHSISSDPLFISVPTDPGAYSSSWDYTIDSTSPAKSAATALTTASNSGTNSTSLTVSDPYFFRSDYGIPSFYSGIVGDSIVVGSALPVAITSINYSTGSLTLASQRSWSNGANVMLYKGGVNVDYIGAKPPVYGVEYNDFVTSDGKTLNTVSGETFKVRQ